MVTDLPVTFTGCYRFPHAATFPTHTLRCGGYVATDGLPLYIHLLCPTLPIAYLQYDLFTDLIWAVGPRLRVICLLPITNVVFHVVYGWILDPITLPRLHWHYGSGWFFQLPVVTVITGYPFNAPVGLLLQFRNCCYAHVLVRCCPYAVTDRFTLIYVYVVTVVVPDHMATTR